MVWLLFSLFGVKAAPSQAGAQWIDPGFDWAAGILEEP